MGTRQPQAFRAQFGGTVNFTASSGSNNVQLDSGGISAATEYRIFNSGSVTVFIEFGTSSAVAASVTTSMPVASGVVEYLRPPVSNVADYYLAGITSSSTSVVYVTAGEGN